MPYNMPVQEKGGLHKLRTERTGLRAARAQRVDLVDENDAGALLHARALE